jgi:hypothetical protein
LQYLGNQLKKVDNGIYYYINYGPELFKGYVKHITLPVEYDYDNNGNMLYDAGGV